MHYEDELPGFVSLCEGHPTALLTYSHRGDQPVLFSIATVCLSSFFAGLAQLFALFPELLLVIGKKILVKLHGSDFDLPK